MTKISGEQLGAFEQIFDSDLARWAFHDTKDPFIRYLRDRRLRIALSKFERMVGCKLEDMSVLLVCGGVGGEASYFANQGFGDVTNSDFSKNALEICKRRDGRLKTVQVDAERADLADGSFDIVVVQDGLHHLPRPALGLNEMVRVAKRGVIVLEPHTGLVAKLIGTDWERHGDAVNFVFRWNHSSFRQVILSQCLEAPIKIASIRLWDHNSIVRRIFSPLKRVSLALPAARGFYGMLTPFNFVGNNFIGLLVKEDSGQ